MEQFNPFGNKQEENKVNPENIENNPSSEMENSAEIAKEIDLESEKLSENQVKVEAKIEEMGGKEAVEAKWSSLDEEKKEGILYRIQDLTRKMKDQAEFASFNLKASGGLALNSVIFYKMAEFFYNNPAVEGGTSTDFGVYLGLGAAAFAGIGGAGFLGSAAKEYIGKIKNGIKLNKERKNLSDLVEKNS